MIKPRALPTLGKLSVLAITLRSPWPQLGIITENYDEKYKI